MTFLVVSLFTLTGTLKLMPFPSASIHYELVSLITRFYKNRDKNDKCMHVGMMYFYARMASDR